MVDQTTHPPKCHSFVGLDRQIGSSPPALKLERERTKEEKEKEVLHLFRCYTHTHTLAQKYLIELLMWNASHVQKTPQLNLTGTVG